LGIIDWFKRWLCLLNERPLAVNYRDGADASRLLHRLCGFPSTYWPSLRAVHQAAEADDPYENKFSTDLYLSEEPLCVKKTALGLEFYCPCPYFHLSHQQNTEVRYEQAV